MTTTLITGANKGLGKETARQLVAAGHTVYVGARDEARGRAAAGELGARFVQLDVTGDASVAVAFAQIEADGGSTSWSTTPASSRAWQATRSLRPRTRRPTRCGRPSRPTSSAWSA